MGALAAACKNNDNNCVTGQCETVGGIEICTQCAKTYVPINGKCVTATGSDKCKDTNGSTDADQTCKKCLLQTFMYKGGCYSTSDAPGSTMCKTVQDGVCTVAADGNAYFVPPETDRDNSHQSVIPCGDDSVVTVKDDKQYKGVANCLTCTAPVSGSANAPTAAVCTKCADGYFGDACTKCYESCLTCSAASESGCMACTEGTHFLGATSGQTGKCVSCSTVQSTWSGVANCAKCTSSNKQNTPATCTECAENYYLKTADDKTTSCVTAEQCNNGFFPTTDGSNKKVCVSCSDTDNGGIENCAKYSLKASSARAGAVVTCTVCTSNKLSPLGDACLTACPAGTYEATATTGSGKICALCHPSCAECNSNTNQDSCTACYPGSVLSYGSDTTKGTCIAECTGRYTENCEANQCTAVLGGSKYCSKCAAGYAPIEGMCTKVATTSRDASGCNAKDGVCTACTGTNYALLSGGCYNTKALPGKAVCTATSGGQCSQCANGQAYTNNNCPACAEGCAKCQSSTSTCTACLAGYYLDSTASKCVKCSETSNGIQGDPNCVNCAPPTGNHKAITYCSKIDSSTSGTRGDGMDRNIFSISVVTCASSQGTLTIGGLAGFFISGQLIATVGIYLLETTDPSTVCEYTSLQASAMCLRG